MPSPVAAPALTLTRIRHGYGARRVLDDVSLQVTAGAVCVIEGANGSGKTTLLRIAAGLLAQEDGQREVEGRALYLRPGAGTRRHLRVDRALGWACRLADVDRQQVSPALQAVGMSAERHSRVGELSSGQRARLTLAVAWCVRPSVICLDEPTAYLDAAGVRQAVLVVHRLVEAGCAVLLASHDGPALHSIADLTVRVTGGRLEVRP